MKLAIGSLTITGLLGIQLSGTSVLTAQDKSVPPPTRLLAAQTSTTEITLVWRGSSTATEYLVFGPRKPADLSGAGVQLGRVSRGGSRYVAAVVRPGVEHHYSIQALGSGDRASTRADFNVVVPVGREASRPLSAPATVEAALTRPGVVTVKWDAVPGATAYSIGRSVRPSGFKPLCQLCDPKPKYVDRDVTPGQVHIYSVAAVGPQGHSRATRSNEVTPTGAAGAESETAEDSLADTTGAGKGAIDLKAGVKSGNAVLLTWGSMFGAQEYQIWRRVGAGLPALIATVAGNLSQFIDYLPVGSIGAVSYTITDLNGKGASNEAVVTLGSLATDSAKARVDSAGSVAKAPSDLKAAVVSPKSAVGSAVAVQLTWLPGSGTTMYQIRRRIGSALPAIVATISGTVSSFLDHLPPGVMGGMVGYTIEAVNGKGATQEVFVNIDPAKAAIDAGSKAPSDLKAAITAPNTVMLNWTGSAGVTYEIQRSIGSGLAKTIGKVVGLVLQFIDQLPIGALPSGVTYTIIASDPKGPAGKASISISDKAAAADSADEEDELDSLPIGRGKIRTQ